MNKRILIAGASHGIGYQTALSCIAADYKVFSISRTTGLLDLNKIEQHFSFDFAHSDNTLPLIEGPIHGVVYCPGSIRLKPFKSLTEKEYLDDFNINVLGAVRLLKHVQPLLSNASIVLFSTVAVASGMNFHASVAASKGAIEGLGRTLAAEWAPTHRVNIIAPSLTDTPLADNLLNNEIKRENAINRHPLKKIGLSADIAGLCFYLLSDASQFMTGQILRPDGGLSSIR